MWSPSALAKTTFLVLCLCLWAAANADVRITAASDAVLVDMVPDYVPRPHTPPPVVPEWLTKQDAHYEYTRYNLQNPEYYDWIAAEMRPLNQQAEEFAYARDWDVFRKGSSKQMDTTEAVIVVACSPERLPFVRRMLHHWQGPMSLAIFIPHPARSRNADVCRERMMDYVGLMATESTSPFAVSFIYANEDSVTLHCNVHGGSTGLEPAWIDRDEQARRYRTKDYLTMFDALYPVNHARNLAVDMVQTNAFVMLVDADFVPSEKPGAMYAAMKRDASMARIRKQWDKTRQREVLVIPAFERLRTNLHESAAASPCAPDNDECWLYEKVDVPYTKAKLVAMVATGELESFYSSKYPAAYGCQNHATWLATSEEYTTRMTPECEPYIIGLKDAFPAYDNRFRGFQVDKVSFLEHVAIMGTKFTVHPQFFITHLPHHKSYSLDDPIDMVANKQAGFDKWTVVRVLQVLAIREKSTAWAFGVLQRGGAPEEDARDQAAVIGKEMSRRMAEYRSVQLPNQTQYQRDMFASTVPRDPLCGPFMSPLETQTA